MKPQPKASSRHQTTQRFAVVGIGASAGGLEAFAELLRHIPSDLGICFVLVQHLDPTHASELARLLARQTTMPTREVTHGLRVEPNHVYVIPPDKNMTIVKGVLNLEPRQEGRRPQHAIDFFFESLAEDQRECAIGVVLSGTATDGTLGLEAIKAEGGITFAQDASAKYDSMPRNAAAAGCVDFVLSPEAIAHELAWIAKHAYVVDAPIDVAASRLKSRAPHEAGERERETATAEQGFNIALPSGGHGTPAIGANRARSKATHDDTRAAFEEFSKVLLLLRNHSGVDFSLYKSPTIQRRISRRMVLGRHGSVAEYAAFLRGNTGELDTLFSDVLISVTSFFRNPEAFDVLKRVVLPKILKQWREDDIRIWVMGCSTGQEAYSVAMAFTEFVEDVPRAPKLQIFATDLNEALLEKARLGLYSKTLAADISPERLRRFFVEEAGGYRVVKSLRDRVAFARHNLISDPPFSRLDLVCCRNLLIYLEPTVQGKALPAFHYALKPEGFLFLGASESLGGSTDLFDPIDKKQKIFAKKGVSAQATLNTTFPHTEPAALVDRRQHPAAVREGIRNKLSARHEADRLMVGKYAPPGVMVDAKLQVIQFRGPTGTYLAPPHGKASFDVLKMARDGLILPLRAAINKAQKDGHPVRTENVRFLVEGTERRVNIEVIPLQTVKERSHLILFEDVAQAPDQTAGTADSDETTTTRSDARMMSKPGSSSASADDTFRGKNGRYTVAALRVRLAESERELAQTRHDLQLVQEEQNAANEELQASHEESQSTNEELQSINEELQTSKEELESTNEELITVNDEMADRNLELSRLNSDLNNLHGNIHTAILVLSRDLTIRRFTPLAEPAFNLLATDVGRPLSSVRHNLHVVSEQGSTKAGITPAGALDLDGIVREVIDSVSVHECEVKDTKGRWYALRARPYLTLDNKIDGAVLALLDIDALKRSEQNAKVARDAAEAIIRAVRDPLVVLHSDLRVHTANEAFYTTFRIDPSAAEGRLVYDLADGQWNLPVLRKLLEEILPKNLAFDEFEMSHAFRDLGERTLLLNGRRLAGVQGTADLILLAIEDITERRRGEAAVQQAAERFRLLTESAPQKVFTATRGGQVDYFNPQWLDYTGLSFAEIKDWGWTQFIHPADLQENVRRWKHSLETGEPFHFEHRFRRLDGEYRWHVTRAVALKDHQGQTLMWVGTNTDIQDVKEADRKKDEFLALLAHELRNPLAPMSNALHMLRHTGNAVESSRPALDLMQRQLGQLVRLVDDLMDAGRINLGKIALRPERIDLATVLYKAVESAQPLTDRMQQVLTLTPSPEPIYLNADPVRLTQVIGNILSNASKFTGVGGRIDLTAERDGLNAVVWVRDTGIGIGADKLPHIFDMFMQIDNSLGRSQSGLGIGLTLVKQLVELHAGTVEAHSAGPEQGSAFVVRLPALSETITAPSALSGPELAATIGRRLLVVDDNVDSATSMAMLLEAIGHEVHVAHDGIEAVAAAARLRPDAILLDIGLPGIDGYEAARRIRREDGNQGLVLVALTGWGQEGDRRRALEAGFDYHLVKPADLATLESLLNAVPARN